MKFSLFLIVCSFAHFIGIAQSRESNVAESCSRRDIQGAEQVDYYQYPSMDKYDVTYLKIDIAAEAGSRFISGNSLTVAKVLQPLDSFNIELKNNMVLDSVFINGVKLGFQRGADHVFVPLPATLPVGSTVNALFYYNGTAANGAVYAGTSGSTGLIYSASLSESYQAREWFPVKQQLKDKIDSADIWIKTSDIYKAGSNGLLVAVVDSPGNKKQYQWKTRYPMNYYMPSFSIGNYLEYVNYAKPAEMTPDSIPVLHYIVDSDTYFLSVKPNLDKTPSFIEKFSELFSLYPFKDEKYGHAHAGIGGGMEHQTMSTMNSFGSTLIAHELAHQWWGDNVTCATWNHIWLNEGFASYGEYLAVEKLPALFPTTNAFAYMQGVHNSAMSQPGGSVFVPNASLFDENRIFSGRLSYNKGSAIVHTLRFEMQDDTLFFNTLKNYQRLYKDSVATAEDMRAVAEATAGRSFSDFFNQWYYGEGYPTFNVTYYKQGIDSVLLVINQTTSAPGVTPFFKGLYEFRISSAGFDTTVLVNLTSNGQAFSFHFTGTPNGVVVDPNNWVLNATGSVTNGGVIPIRLINFDATTGDCKALLHWETSNEFNSDRFEIETSTDGITYQSAGTVASRNIAGGSNYEFSMPLVRKYYARLKQVDRDGGFTYSSAILLTPDCSKEMSIDISPNPASGNSTILINVSAATQAQLRLFNISGKLVFTDDIRLNPGYNQISGGFIESLPPGTYLLVAETGSEKANRKFIKR